jgi:predicted ATPase
MITEFKIENYKSIEDLSIKLGRINVLIGENGCGKSNILEAIALTSAATQNKLDNEFLSSRGIRVTKPQLMRSAFEFEKTSQPIKLIFTIDEVDKFKFLLNNDNQLYSNWESKQTIISKNQIDGFSKELFESILQPDQNETYLKLKNFLDKLEIKEENKDLNNLFQKLFQYSYKYLPSFILKDFLIYSPENTSLRTFEKEGQIEPLGIYGEGLFKLLKYFASQSEKENFMEIKKYLKLFDWFKDFSIPENLFEGESFLQIKDRFIDSKIEYFDQKSSNEGFLFVLFYFSLIISDLTPKFFAIDNIEASLNPKLCTKLIKSISELAKIHDKQIIITTHSPSVLDGLDLNDEEQKLFLVYRNKFGHTVLNQIEKPKPLEGQEPVKLSDAFLRGYIGGLPKNFSI